MNTQKKDESECSALLAVDTDKALLRQLITQKQMNKNAMATEATKTEMFRVDDYFIQVSRRDYDRLIDLAIKALRNKYDS